MKKEYDFSKAVKNPYTKKLKKQITIRINEEAIDYFQTMSKEIGIPYQNLINMYLQDCAKSNKRLSLTWN